jgi:hypothetical protein
MKQVLKIIIYPFIPFLYMILSYILMQYDITNSLGYYMTGGNAAVFTVWLVYGVWIISKFTYNKLTIKLN